MFPLAGQTAGPNGLIFLWTLMGSLGVTKIFLPLATPVLQLVLMKEVELR